MIRVDNLAKYFGPVQAVDHISFSVARGEIVGFLGPNGAGKTTSMRILTTYLPASEGSARVAGAPHPRSGASSGCDAERVPRNRLTILPVRV